MPKSTTTAKRVPYDLRHAKQVERRMLIDFFQQLAVGGFPIREYQYTGFGSVFFIDFALFHKMLGIKRLISLEHDSTIAKRVKFNRPFASIRIKIADASSIIPTLGTRRRHILWLDYDYRLDSSVLSDLAQASFRLTPGSILLATFNTSPVRKTPKEEMAYYSEQAQAFIELAWTESDFSPANLHKTLPKIAHNAILNGLISRQGLQFVPFFNFQYQDGAPMSTYGGMICSNTEAQMLAKCSFSDLVFLRSDPKVAPYKIFVPFLTRKERIHLDHRMPCAKGWRPREFELSDKEIESYSEIYRFYPAFAELML